MAAAAVSPAPVEASAKKRGGKSKSPAPALKFAEDESVMSKYPGTSLYYPSKVVYVRHEDREYDVLFENGKTFTLPAADVKAEIKKKTE